RDAAGGCGSLGPQMAPVMEEQETETRGGAGWGPSTPRERVADRACVLYLADQGGLGARDASHTTAGVLDAVRGDLIHGEGEVIHSHGRGAGGRPEPDDSATDLREGAHRQRPGRRGRRRRRQAVRELR